MRESVQGMGTELRKMSKVSKRDKPEEESTMRREDFEGLSKSALEEAQVATRSKTEFSISDVKELSVGRKDLSRITSSAYMNSLEERGIVDRSVTKILNRRKPRIEP